MVLGLYKVAATLLTLVPATLWASHLMYFTCGLNIFKRLPPGFFHPGSTQMSHFLAIGSGIQMLPHQEMLPHEDVHALETSFFRIEGFPRAGRAVGFAEVRSAHNHRSSGTHPRLKLFVGGHSPTFGGVRSDAMVGATDKILALRTNIFGAEENFLGDVSSSDLVLGGTLPKYPGDFF